MFRNLLNPSSFTCHWAKNLLMLPYFSKREDFWEENENWGMAFGIPRKIPLLIACTGLLWQNFSNFSVSNGGSNPVKLNGSLRYQSFTISLPYSSTLPFTNYEIVLNLRVLLCDFFVSTTSGQRGSDTQQLTTAHSKDNTILALYLYFTLNSSTPSFTATASWHYNNSNLALQPLVFSITLIEHASLTVY